MNVAKENVAATEKAGPEAETGGGPEIAIDDEIEVARDIVISVIDMTNMKEGVPGTVHKKGIEKDRPSEIGSGVMILAKDKGTEVAVPI